MIELCRIGEAPKGEGTIGLLSIGPYGRLYTMERGWADNEPSVSCVPAGEYTLEPHNSHDHPDTWALVGETVSHYPGHGKSRCLILFHVANWASELRGCIAVGLNVGFLSTRVAVISSGEAMKRLRRYMRIEADPRLIIKERSP